MRLCVGWELCREWAGSGHTCEAVHSMRVAARDSIGVGLALLLCLFHSLLVPRDTFQETRRINASVVSEAGPHQDRM